MKVLYWTIAAAASGVVLAGAWLKQRFTPSEFSPGESVAQTVTGDRFAAARQQAWEAAVLVQNPPHPLETWQQAKVKWRQSIRLLEAIPPTAPTAAQVQQKLGIYRQNYAEISDRLAAEESAVSHLQTAKDLAWQAAVLVQNPPHSLRVWQRAEDKWQAAIAQLELISPKTSVFQQREEKLALYRANRHQISQRVNTENIAQSCLQRLVAADARLSPLPKRAFINATTEPLGITQEDYDRLVQGLESALNEFEQSGEKHPLLLELQTLVEDYRFANTLWKSYLTFKQHNSEWLNGEEPFNQLVPLSAADRDRLLERYRFEPFSSGKRVSLKFTVWEIWSHVHEQLVKTQEKFQAMG